MRMVTKCPNTGLTIPECSCLACLTKLLNSQAPVGAPHPNVFA